MSARAINLSMNAARRTVPRCQRNLAGREEDSGRYMAYVPCGKPATWTVDPDGDEWHACERHADEALMDGCEVQS